MKVCELWMLSKTEIAKTLFSEETEGWTHKS